MQSLGRKWNSSKDFNFTSNEGTCWFLKGRNKVNCYQLFQEGCNQMESAVIANSNYPFKELEKKIIRVKISWSINFARTCYCWENSKFRWCCYSNRSWHSWDRNYRNLSLPTNRSWRRGEQWWRRKFNCGLFLSKERKGVKIKSLICSWCFEDAVIYSDKGDEMQIIIFKFEKVFDKPISGRRKF